MLPSTTTALGSTLARPDVPTSSPSFSPKHQDSTSSTNVDNKLSSSSSVGSKGALSMDLDELGQVLGGRGRAQIAWDCYSIGIDPHNFFGSVIRLGYDDYESIYGMLPNSRRSQRLGKDALEKLSALYPTTGGKVEDGVATLSHISRSKDGTTKLLLKLHDGLTVETVIIPWKGGRSTLCVSSQVGCRQGRFR
jgi:hypothetical protein